MAEIEFSITDNPHFSRVDRAPYELGHLLRELPADFSAFKPEEEEHCRIAAAAAHHALNASLTVLNGIEAMGKVMSIAADNEQSELEPGTLRDFGALIQHLAVEAQFLNETQSMLFHAVRAQEKRLNNAKPGKAGAK